MNEFLLGGAAVAALGIALFFVVLWSRTHDRLYALFALAFAILGVNRLLLAAPEDEHEIVVFSLRAVAFPIIIAAIVDKNRPSSVG